MSERKIILYPLAHTSIEAGIKDKTGDPFAYSLINGIYRHASALGNDLSGFKIYMDSMPNAGKDIVERKLRTIKNSPTLTVVRLLKNRGAEVIGSEDPLIVARMAEFEFDPNRSEDEYDDFLRNAAEPRAKYIAGVVKSTLGPNETGLVFQGIADEVERFLHPLRVVLPEEILLDIVTGSPELLTSSTGFEYFSRFMRKQAYLQNVSRMD